MKTFILPIFLFTLMGNAWSLDFDIPSEHAKKYLVVGVSGFKTGRDRSESENILSNKIGKDSEPSGAWENLNTRHKKILKNAYLTHYSTNAEIDSVIKLALDENGECLKDTGLIMMVNSWGAKTSQKLAQKFLKKCGQLPALTVLIEGVSKPSPIAYDKPIYSLNCVNFYQTDSSLHGAPIANCHNTKLSFPSDKTDLFNAHIHAEWKGSARGQEIIQDFLNERLSVTFVRDMGIDTQKGLD